VLGYVVLDMDLPLKPNLELQTSNSITLIMAVFDNALLVPRNYDNFLSEHLQFSINICFFSQSDIL